MGILMRLTNEGGDPPWGTCPINTILILTFRIRIKQDRSPPDGSIQRLFAEFTVVDRQVRQALAFASALVLGRI